MRTTVEELLTASHEVALVTRQHLAAKHPRPPRRDEVWPPESQMLLTLCDLVEELTAHLRARVVIGAGGAEARIAELEAADRFANAITGPLLVENGQLINKLLKAEGEIERLRRLI